MNIESLAPFLLILAPFAIAFLIEALVIYFFKLKKFWASVGISIVINLLSIALVYFIVSFILSKIGYEFNGLQLDPPVIAFLWWVSAVAEGLLLQLFIREDKKRIFTASIIMNAISYLFLYFFITNSH